MLLWATVVWSSCLLSWWLARQRSVLFVHCETIGNYFPISLRDAETTEHERFSTTAACSRWLITSWRMTTLWGDGTCHWQMMYQNGHRYRLAQAVTPIFNNLMSDAGAVTSSFRLFVIRSSTGILRKDDIKKISLYSSAKLPKHQENLDSDPGERPWHWLGVNRTVIILVTAFNFR